MNITSGRIDTPTVNVHNAISIREALLADIEKSCPGGFYNTIPKKGDNYGTISQISKGWLLKECDLNAIYSRIIVIFYQVTVMSSLMSFPQCHLQYSRRWYTYRKRQISSVEVPKRKGFQLKCRTFRRDSH